MKLSKRFLIVPVVLALFSYLFYSAYRDVKDRTLDEFYVRQFTLTKHVVLGIDRKHHDTKFKYIQTN